MTVYEVASEKALAMTRWLNSLWLRLCCDVYYVLFQLHLHTHNFFVCFYQFVPGFHHKLKANLRL